MKKIEELALLHKEVIEDKLLPLAESNLVFGEGNPDSEVVFIGEAPGAKEDELIRPFVGRSGQLLRSLIRAEGWKEEGVYITNIVKRRPPENRDPTTEEIDAYKPYLTRQIKILNPKIIATLGRFSMNYFLPEAKISRDHGRVFKFGKRILIPLYHPAAALRSTSMKSALESDFKKIPQLLKKFDDLMNQNKNDLAQKETKPILQENLL